MHRSVLFILRPLHRWLRTLQDFQTITSRNVRQSSHTTAVRGNVEDWRTKLQTLEGPVYIQKVRLFKTYIDATLKDCSLAGWKSVLENHALVCRSTISELYSISSFNHSITYFLAFKSRLRTASLNTFSRMSFPPILKDVKVSSVCSVLC